MKVLVTGGSGFLGSSVVAGLKAAGHDVTSADLRVPPQRMFGVHHVQLDVTDPDQVMAAIGSARPEVVVHLASIVTPGKSTTRAQEYAVDVLGSAHVLGACLAHGVRRVVVSSSGAVYGYRADNPVPLRETDPARGSEEFAYSHHKWLLEQKLAELRESDPALEQVVLRIGTILGERVDNQITALFERDKLLKIRGADSPFVFIWDTDVVEIVLRAVTGPFTGVVNVAGDGWLTVDQLAELLGKQTATIPEPVLRLALAAAKRLGRTAYGPEQTRFLQYRPVLANDRLKNEFGYTPRYTSREAFEAWRDRARDA